MANVTQTNNKIAHYEEELKAAKAKIAFHAKWEKSDRKRATDFSLTNPEGAMMVMECVVGHQVARHEAVRRAAFCEKAIMFLENGGYF